MKTRRLGKNGPVVGALGLGTGGMAESRDDAESVATIQAAIEAGASLLNTGDFYGMGHAERLVAEAIEGRRDQAFLSVKYGGLRGPDGHFLGIDTRPASTKNFLAYTLRRLGTDYVDLYEPARVDPTVPIEETIGAIADLVKAGYVRYVGLSEAGPTTIRRANAVHPIAAVEVEYSLMGRDIEDNVLPVARELGLGVVAYSVLSGGLLSGRVRAPVGDGPAPPARPATEANLKLVERLRTLAGARGVTPTQLAFAWVLARGEEIVPLAGVSNRARLTEALGALAITLSPADLVEIEAAVPKDADTGSIYSGFVLEMIRRERSR